MNCCAVPLVIDGLAGVTAIDCSGAEAIVVASAAFAVNDPPPHTAAVFVTLAAAFPATLTVTVTVA